jgi:hypothetical protein
LESVTSSANGWPLSPGDFPFEMTLGYGLSVLLARQRNKIEKGPQVHQKLFLPKCNIIVFSKQISWILKRLLNFNTFGLKKYF